MLMHEFPKCTLPCAYIGVLSCIDHLYRSVPLALTAFAITALTICRHPVRSADSPKNNGCIDTLNSKVYMVLLAGGVLVLYSREFDSKIQIPRSYRSAHSITVSSLSKRSELVTDGMGRRCRSKVA